MPKPSHAALSFHDVLLFLLIGLLVWLAYLVLAPFLSPLAWAGVLAYTTWPVFLRVRARLGGRKSLSALICVTGLALTIVFPLLWLVFLVQEDLMKAYHAAVAYISQPHPTLPDMFSRLPWIGPRLRDWLIEHLSDSTVWEQHLAQWLQFGVNRLLPVLGGIGRNSTKLMFSLLALFFFYRDGESVLRQIRIALKNLVGDRADIYLNAAGDMSRAIVQSVILAALLQGMIAGIGYWLIGVEPAGILGIGTAFASVIPAFGTLLVWGPVSVLLLMEGHPWQAAALIAWGILVVNPVDNIVRPLLISSAAEVPFLPMMFGALGGIAAFGLIGLFLGPVILAIFIAAWKEWIDSSAGSESERTL